MNDYRPDIPAVPQRMRSLPIRRGYPVPWFVAMVEGDFHFPTADAKKLLEAVNKRLCWVCGQPLGRNVTFVAGTLCAVNRTTSEPPCHRECAIFSARACPFLTRPHMKRQKEHAPGSSEPAGVMLQRNPGVAMVWTTRDYWLKPIQGGVLFSIADPIEVMWFAEGRAATRDEIMESLSSGLPLLAALASDSSDKLQLDRLYTAALRLVPE